MDTDLSVVESWMKNMDDFGNVFTEYVDYVFRRADTSKLVELAEYRQFSVGILQKQKIFYVPKSGASLMVPKYQEYLRDFGVLSARNKPTFYDRWIIPIFNSKGQVINLVGYSYTSDIRYLYGVAPYYDRKNTLYGLENLDMVSELGYAIIVEGITDAIRLRDMGFLNTFAMCGTGNSTFIYDQINRRATRGVICIPDRDEPGQKAQSRWQFDASITVWVDPRYKDIDEMCKKHPDGIKVTTKVLRRLLDEYDSMRDVEIPYVTIRLAS